MHLGSQRRQYGSNSTGRIHHGEDPFAIEPRSKHTAGNLGDEVTVEEGTEKMALHLLAPNKGTVLFIREQWEINKK